MATQTALKDAVIHDHNEMYQYYDQYQQSKGNVDAQARWARQLTWEIARHAVGEEIVVYPLMEKHLGQKGVQLADEDRADHQTVKELLARLETLTPGTSEYDDTLSGAMADLRKHNESEEQNDLPLLEEKLSMGDSQQAATLFTRTNKFVPTRAHPMAPNKPPYETLVGFMAAPIDKLKDYFASFPTEEMKKDAGIH
ncbi:hypothetical protein SERLA73DRAFT_188542 [Serpula lacrymans var. lacrymans S7.3]|uniref:Hemerythrin-like domain-containing protein n=2 Tax=Serpula lacrymans var. lacrymans TaxID=341189 RepID=F8QBI5_SERL3|nr:uncharacterized protein SERLADRAFT_478681 [Serpula lacrymans var. lacrymans S7.9]EGN94571.1 hypothetical protein SERLA73DRAFT_188542 [Serpula lacrymans var. lacrymans S7.3]EGO20048.1 hypothetical protein SERLADRAFT_478681 [Serpula lacrymans var. lacrymans S7.9]